MEAPSDEGGYCESPNLPRREIVIPVHGETKRDLEVTVHEALHACFWDMDEEVIQEAGENISKLLWRLGWRKD